MSDWSAEHAQINNNILELLLQTLLSLCKPINQIYYSMCRTQDKISVYTEYISMPTQIGSHIISVTINQLYIKHQQKKMS